MSETPETDAESMDGIDPYGDPLKSWDYKASKDGEVVPAEFARKLERERDEARREIKRLKKELVSANRGAEINAKVNQSLAKKLHDLEGYAARTLAHLQACSTMRGEALKERDEARREMDEALQRLSVWHGAVSQMKNQLSFAPPFHQGIDAQEEA